MICSITAYLCMKYNNNKYILYHIITIVFFHHQSNHQPYDYRAAPWHPQRVEDYQAMRWLESGGAGGGTKVPLVRKLLMALLRPEA